MENKFKIKKGLEIYGSLGTLLDVQGDYGQLFSVTDSLTGDLFSVSDISGAPILNVNSSGLVTLDGTLNVSEFIRHEGDIGTSIQMLAGQMIIKNSGGKYINLHSNNNIYYEAVNHVFYNDILVNDTITSSKAGTNFIMDGAAGAEGIRMTADSSTTYPVFLRSTNPASGESSPWIYKEDSTPWGIWHNNPINSFEFTRSGAVAGAITTNVGGESNSVMIRLNNTDGAGTFAGTLSAPFITASNSQGAADGSAQEVARFVNIAAGATSSYMYIGASSGTDWRLGKNINGSAGNTNFGITKHSGTDIFLGIDGSGNTSIHGSLTTGGGIQAGGAISSPQKVFHAAAVGANYVKIYRAEGTTSQIAGTVRISGTSHGGSHVSNFTAYVVVNHSGDILIKSISGNYNQVVLKVESDGNEDYHLSIKSDGPTSTPTYYFTIEALTDRLTLTKAPTSTPATTAVLEHTTKFGLNITGTGGNMTNGITGDLTLVGDLGAQGASFSGDITMSAASQLIFPDNSSIPDNPTNEKHDYIRFNSGSISQISGRVGLMLTSQDDSLVLANGDVGKAFVDTNINVDAEEIYMLSDNSIQLITDLQDGWDGSPTPYYTHQFLGGEHTRTNSTGDSVSFLHTGSENVMRYKGIVTGDWDTIFSQTDGHMGVYEVQNIIAGTGANAHSNYPTGAYSFGGVMSWQLSNSTFKLYAPHTGTLWYQTGWNNDEYSGWRKVWDNGNDGAGSGLDADTVDGIQGASFLRSDVADTAAGAITIGAHLQFGNCTMSKSGDNNHIHVNCPTAFIPESTTLADNTALGTSSYRWKTFHAGPGNFLGSVTASADVVAYSDIKLKENIKTLDGSKVLQMRGVSFDRKDNGASSSGVIAQEMQKVAPELVSDDEGTLGVAYGNLTGYLIEAIKEQQKQIDELKKLIKNGNNL
jgi:hypothetical protein